MRAVIAKFLMRGIERERETYTRNYKAYRAAILEQVNQLSLENDEHSSSQAIVDMHLSALCQLDDDFQLKKYGWANKMASIQNRWGIKINK